MPAAAQGAFCSMGYTTTFALPVFIIIPKSKESSWENIAVLVCIKDTWHDPTAAPGQCVPGVHMHFILFVFQVASTS